MRRLTSFHAFQDASSQIFFPVTVFMARVLFGLMFFWAGWTKWTADAWSASGFLSHASGPFATWFQSLAGSTIVDQMNVWGLLLLGTALILGVFVRTASFLGIVLMLLYYFADFTGNTAHGLIDEHILYMSVLAIFCAGGFGHVFGLDALIESRFAPNQAWLKRFFG